MKNQTLFPSVIAKLKAAGISGDIIELANIIRTHKLQGKLVVEANRIYREAEIEAHRIVPTKKVIAKGTFSRGWEIARGLREQFGTGKVSDYFNRGLRLAWQEVKLSMA